MNIGSVFSGLLAVLFLVILTGCEDPSNVGIGLIGEQGAAPFDTTIQPVSFDNVPLRDVTGNADRFLAGPTNDPLFGSIAGSAYIDFGAPVNVASAFQTGTVTRVMLNLRPTYVYGDTTSAVTLALHDVLAEFSGQGVTADTSLAVGPLITEFTFLPTDTLVQISMPSDWVATHDPALRSTTFLEQFHGLKIAPVSGNAVVGFSRSDAILRASTGSDSIAVAVAKNFTSYERGEPATLPEGRRALQDGVGPGLELAIEIPEGLTDQALNRSILVLETDSLLLRENLPSGFHRPAIRRVDLYARLPEGRTDVELNVEVDADGRFLFQSSKFRAIMQAVVLGTITVEAFEIEVPPASNSVNAQVFFGLDAEERAPRAVLTITPIDG